jgi:hypothetical protein
MKKEDLIEMIANPAKRLDFTESLVWFSTTEPEYPFSEFQPGVKAEPFAYDVFADVFVVLENGIGRVATETGALDETWASLDAWAEEVIANPEEILGEELLQNWSARFGQLQPGYRLTPKMPFIFGGTYELDNIVAMPIGDILQFRAEIARQVKDLPDGARVLIDTD